MDKLKKLSNYIQNPHGSVFKELSDINENLGVVGEAMKGFDFSKIEMIKGEKGDVGERGESIVGPQGPQGVPGKFTVGTPGRDGKDGKDGKVGPSGPRGEGSPDTAEQIKSKLESLKEDARLGIEAVKGIPTIKEIVKELKSLQGKDRLGVNNIEGMPYPNSKVQDQRWHGAGVTKIIPGANITITSTGDPFGLGDVTISAAAGGGTSVNNEVPAGAINGVNHVYTTAQTYVANSTHVYLNGIRQRIGGGFDYTESGVSQITFVVAPVVGDFIIMDYQH